MDLNQLAKEIIEKNEYLTLATVDEIGKPWVSILAYAFDKNYNFYFISLPSSKHSIHMEKNQFVAFSIFDSQQQFGKGTGLQIEGKVQEVVEKETHIAEKIYFERKYPYGDMNNDFMVGVKKLLNDKIYRFYKIEVVNCWINDPQADTDKRVKVSLK